MEVTSIRFVNPNRRLSSRKPYDKNVEKKKTREKKREYEKNKKYGKRKRTNVATRSMIKERRGRIIVVAGSSASFIDNDSVDKRLSRLSVFTLSIHNKQGFLVASSSSLALSQEHANTKRCSVFLSETMYPIHLARSFSPL